MRCELSRDYRFEAAHRLPRVPATHKCSRVHGHSYHISVTVAGEVDPDMGWVLDFADVDKVVTPVIESLDHQLLNELPGLENPTSEILAGWMWGRIAPGLPGLVEIMVSETPSSRCIYRGG
ncbi:6-carboxytetrahydropterin synthase QueD [Haliangium sp.]|uniref:6-carboxytetrahydropterin synthase QueD n=1 Tax=Haliangium sp. TaxID=2663208 RepID=UPI003D0A3046